ncbi:MAG: polysaccharide deacetylase family protein [Thermoplasmata archaeon]|nr:MAG: polysaccharide deacetylase family protein [Thermoplasmata archaeon]
MNISITFDLEVDCPPFNDSTRGITEGLPKILAMLDKYDIRATFFVVGNIAEKYPEIIKDLSQKHEVGSHGYHHESFNEMDKTKMGALNKSKKLLEKITETEVLGFRAPYLRVCNELYTVLDDLGFEYDASMASFMKSHRELNSHKLQKFKLGIPNVILRFPAGMKKFKNYCTSDPFPILFFHTWEILPMREILPKSMKGYYFRPDNWYNTGDEFQRRFGVLLEFLHAGKFKFVMLRDML